MDIVYDMRFWMFVWTIFTCGLQWYVGYRMLSTTVKQNTEAIAALEKKYEKDKTDRTGLLMGISNDVSHIKGQLESDNKIIKVLEKIIK